ncbi:TIGR03749 family integrating conjugative element protein [Pseudomonas synxantha]|uniref:Integrating conjugative element protein (TIGR03749 family) n=1 Tax=Pseudomonas synxantha TaxID=47883 RepID=A0ACC6JS80_9PSED|nr:TIGR03749 family integrating conjugative element protein [Pseudomonas synxantha]MDR6609059.1 integrating conjugative element protein (TIGR03749 family) [Pseudomonas synxantha]
MRRALLSAPLGFVLTFTGITASHSIEIMRWERLPLAIPLIVGQERVVFVERNVRVGLPASLDDKLRVQSAAGTVYLRANEPIEPTRLQLQDATTGELILVDIMAKSAESGQMPLEAIRIVEASLPIRQTDATLHAVDKPTPASNPTPLPIVLTRYAAQNLYAPLRTVEALPGVRRVNLPADLSLDLLLPSLSVHARPLASWRLEDYWVTAIRLTNQTNQIVDLDPRYLQGDFATATFQHHNLGPKGTSPDTTVLYLTTRGHGLVQSLLPTISPVDAALNLPRSTNMASATEARDEK